MKINNIKKSKDKKYTQKLTNKKSIKICNPYQENKELTNCIIKYLCCLNKNR